MGKCKFCGANGNGRNFNIYDGIGVLQKDVYICLDCFKTLTDLGVVACNFCGKAVPCVGKSESFHKVWQYIPSKKSFQLQNICKWAVAESLANKCPCCSGDVLCSEEVLTLLGKCPNCYQADLLFEQYCEHIEDLDALEHF